MGSSSYNAILQTDEPPHKKSHQKSEPTRGGNAIGAPLFDDLQKMNRKDLATVLVRFAGLYFAYLSVTKILTLLSFFYMISMMLSDTSADEMEITEKLNLFTSVPGVISFLVTSTIAFYLLKKGKWVIGFLSNDSTN